MVILNSECFAHEAGIGLNAKLVNVARAGVVTSKPKLKLPVLAATPKVAPYVKLSSTSEDRWC